MIEIIRTPSETAIALKLSGHINERQFGDIEAFIEAILEHEPDQQFALYIDIDENVNITSRAYIHELRFGLKYQHRFTRTAVITSKKSLASIVKFYEYLHRNSHLRHFSEGDEGAAMVWAIDKPYSSAVEY